MSHMLERNHHQQLQDKPGDRRSRHSMEGCKARLKALCETMDGRLMRETVCRRYVLRMVKEALKAQTTASESPRPSKRHKPNSVSSLASPQRKFGRSDTLSTPKEHLNFDVDTSDDDIKQEEFSEPSASKTILPVLAKCCKLIRYDRPTRQLEHRMPCLCKECSHGKDKRSSGQRL